MKIDPKHLMYLSAVVEAGGVTEGAALLGTTQPAMSRIITMLEARLGESLFLRGKRPLQATPLCRTLAEHGSAIIDSAKRAANSVDDFRQGEAGAIRIGGTPFLMDALVSGLIAEFQSAHDRVRVNQSYGYTDELMSLTLSGKIDLAFCPVDFLDADTDLEFIRLLPGRNVIACRDNHPLLQVSDLGKKLLDYPWIAPPPSSPLNADLRSTLVSLGADRIRIGYSGGSLGSVINHMRNSDSLAVLPHSVVLAMGEASGITALPIKINHPARAIGVLTRRSSRRTAVLAKFIMHLCTKLELMRQLTGDPDAALPA